MCQLFVAVFLPIFLDLFLYSFQCLFQSSFLSFFLSSVCSFVCVCVLRYMHCTHTTAHSNDTVKHTHCLAQAGLKYLAQVTDKKAD